MPLQLYVDWGTQSLGFSLSLPWLSVSATLYMFPFVLAGGPYIPPGTCRLLRLFQSLLSMHTALHVYTALLNTGHVRGAFPRTTIAVSFSNPLHRFLIVLLVYSLPNQYASWLSWFSCPATPTADGAAGRKVGVKAPQAKALRSHQFLQRFNHLSWLNAFNLLEAFDQFPGSKNGCYW